MTEDRMARHGLATGLEPPSSGSCTNWVVTIGHLAAVLDFERSPATVLTVAAAARSEITQRSCQNVGKHIEHVGDVLQPAASALSP
ncbi:MAG: hypothetical protein IPL91_11270 [Hyphomicrobium sp.]|nr:hypothetical protein [Hyphomicrobium sp.]